MNRRSINKRKIDLEELGDIEEVEEIGLIEVMGPVEEIQAVEMWSDSRKQKNLYIVKIGEPWGIEEVYDIEEREGMGER